MATFGRPYCARQNSPDDKMGAKRKPEMSSISPASWMEIGWVDGEKTSIPASS